MKRIICFGEVLWDVFPSQKRIGGAPLNVAVRLRSFGHQVCLISRIGKDEDGIEICRFLKDADIGTVHLQKDSMYKTGIVSISLDEEGSASYSIDFPSAWDYIAYNKKIDMELSLADAFIYGSLAARNNTTQKTLLQLLEKATFKVFDVNLRAPYYTVELLLILMKKADFIKFNEEELKEVTSYMGFRHPDVKENIRFLSKKTNTSQICVTKGKHGAVFLFNNQIYSHEGYKIGVVDTVGAGDSFLASLIHCLLDGKKPEYALDYASAVGALVAGSKGANPEVSLEDINFFRSQ